MTIEQHPELPDVSMVEAVIEGQSGRMLWYPAGDVNEAAIVVEAIKPNTILLGNHCGESITMPGRDLEITISMLRDQRRWLRYGDGPGDAPLREGVE